MDAKIRCTSEGTYYVQLEAENTIERIEMTALYKQLRANGNVLTEFGSKSSHCAEVGQSLETQISFLVRTIAEPAQHPSPNDHKNKKHSLFSRFPEW